jgi:hypothetical protein
MKLAGHAARRGRGEMHPKFWLENLMGRDIGVDEKITLDCMLEN